MTEALRFHIARAWRGAHPVLAEVAWQCDPCGLHAIVGPNGAGKSTVLRVLAGLERFEGSVAIGDRDLTRADAKLRASLLAWVPQAHAVPEGVRARHVVELGRAWHTETAALRRGHVEAALEACGVGHLADRWFEELSAGQRQRVVLARALATDAPVLLLDEPFASIDLGAALALEALLRTFVRRGKLAVVVLHDLAQASRLAERVLVLAGGRAVTEGPPLSALSPRTLADVWGVRAVDPSLSRFLPSESP